MADETPPVTPVGANDPAERVAATQPARPVGAPEPARTAPALRPGASPAEAQVGDAAVHEQLEHPVRQPPGVAARATVHDAAVHGDRVAAAIDARGASRAEQLAGAAASAGSGQAAKVDLASAPDVEPSSGDPLAPVHAIDEDPHRQDPRSTEEQQADDDLDP